MAVLLAALVGGLYACGLYLVLRRNLVKLLLGLLLLGHAANLLIFSAPGVVRGRAPLVAVGELSPPPEAADPVPQALILTAIVIGFAVVAFAAVLARRVFEVVGTDDPDAMEDAP